MRFLIVSAVLACATAVPSGLLAAPYGHGLVGHGLVGHGLAGHGLVGHGAHLAYAAAPLAVAHAAPALPTISPGDLHGAAIEAHVEASDHVRAAVDANRELHDQAAELHGQAVNAAEDHSWQAVDAVKTAEAQLDGAAAGAAPVLAKQLVGHSAYATAPALVGHSAYAAGPALVGHSAYAAAPALVGHSAYAAAPALVGHSAYGGHQSTVVSQSLHQSHPAPLVHAAPVAYAAHAAPLLATGYAHGGYAHGSYAHAGYGAHGLAHW